ncbi:hypothetical protein [Lentzea flaviverrucosa]|jgi:hypothetical protein|uniref:Uncharacterized protein n=1 Tax=Lentzea flaviverrucosa TaxID=200379 RepID=A0A1H9HKQ6_9PSEU|nr:hypothetical protein [Lentzea flaviverrucosa]RDI34556.1 hypothetical protein DFR72_101304 [Lentzea flaviverrucosa]SEQ62931.1 hypothetical protein SAMN05216195_102913 [Lentzea flaviverrucosa]
MSTRPVLVVVTVAVLVYWAELLLRLAQTYLLHTPEPHARGLLGVALPWLAESGWAHHGVAFVVLAGCLVAHRGAARAEVT